MGNGQNVLVRHIEAVEDRTAPDFLEPGTYGWWPPDFDQEA